MNLTKYITLQIIFGTILFYLLCSILCVSFDFRTWGTFLLIKFFIGYLCSIVLIIFINLRQTKN